MRFSPTRVAQARSARLLYGHRLLAGALGVLVGFVSLAVDPVHRGQRWRVNETRVLEGTCSRRYADVSDRTCRLLQRVLFPLLREYGATAVRQYATQVQVQVQTIPTHSHTRERSVCFPRGVDSTDLLEYPPVLLETTERASAYGSNTAQVTGPGTNYPHHDNNAA